MRIVATVVVVLTPGTRYTRKTLGPVGGTEDGEKCTSYKVPGVPVARIVSSSIEVLKEEICPLLVELLLQILDVFYHLDILEVCIQVLITSTKNLHLCSEKLSNHLLVNIAKCFLVVNITRSTCLMTEGSEIRAFGPQAIMYV